ncbi:MlaD family protein [Aureispira anguillae]|uniref:MlaD family protein n=1 Tax=Aureispira anguillae TaxID=2864201 RepID=A0A916DTH4_9BACT|nr:MlaD family protein [Aureispira anguillae]BDS13239.1 MlaD family protein [Aureispira anguillae]
MNISKEAKVGFIGLVVLFSTLFLFNYLNRKNVFSTNLIIIAEFDDIEFLKKGNLVLIKGREYGRVAAIYKKEGRLLVDMDIDPSTQIPPNAKAVISEASLLGGRTVSIVYEGACTNNCLQSGAIIPGEISNMATQVAAVAEPILKSFGKIADTLMGPNGMEAMLAKAYASAAGLAKTTKGFEGKMRGMNRTLPSTIKNFKELTASLLKDGTMETMANSSESNEMALALDSLVNNLSSLSQDDIDAMTKILYTLNEQAKTFPEKVNQGKAMLKKADKGLDKLSQKIAPYQEGASGTIPKLLYDADYKDSLNHKIQNVAQKIRDIREHPEENVTLRKKK